MTVKSMPVTVKSMPKLRIDQECNGDGPFKDAFRWT